MFKSLDNLQLYLENGLNVLLSGRHGVGKSTIVLQLFEKYFPGNYLYFSTSTLDPWIDLIGVPREQKNDKGETYLDLLRPKFFENDSVQAILFDEVNRAPAKVRNAIMELVQFRSINGYKFNNLKVIWACKNPDDDKDYDTERLDKAFEDRFHINIDLPYLIDKDYFENKFGREISGPAIEWWNELEQEIRYSVSPRRLEYALDVWNIHGNLKDVLPKTANVTKLVENLKIGSMATRANKLLNEADEEIIKKELENPNMVSFIKKQLDQSIMIEKFAKFLPEEFIMEQAPNNYELCSYIKKNMNQFEPSLISSLDTQGCFKESSFKDLFAEMNTNFPQAIYSSKDRHKIEEVLKKIPDMNNVKIRQGDKAQLNKTINLLGTFCTIAKNTTVDKMNVLYNFIEKMAQLDELNTINNYGLNFDGAALPLKLKIEDYKRTLKDLTAVTSTKNTFVQQIVDTNQNIGNITIMTPDGSQTLGHMISVHQNPNDGQYNFVENTSN